MVNAYDFDGTIYDGDSTLDFYLFCLRKNKRIFSLLPGQALAFLQYGLGRRSKEGCKEQFYRFLTCFEDPEALAVSFWESHRRKIKAFYLRQKNEQDLIISASPEFLLRPLCATLGLSRLIASQVDPRTGKLLGPNCRGQEKVKRLFSEYGDIRIQRFYSDSLADLPLAKLAAEAYRVRKNNLCRWKC
jgi:phosphatidylglycerophosphatase C